MRATLVVSVITGALGCQPASVDLSLPVLPSPVPFSGNCGSTPTVLAHVPGILPRPMAFDLGNLYVVASSSAGDPSRQQLWRVPLRGAPPHLLADNQTRIGGIDVELSSGATSRVFWTTGSGPSDAGATGAVWSMDPSQVVAVVVASNRSEPGALIVVGDRLVWAEESLDDAGQAQSAIVRVATDGGEITTLQSIDGGGLPQTFDVGPTPLDPNFLFWSTASPTLANQREATVSGCALTVPSGARTPIVGPDSGGAGAIETTSTGDIFYSGPTGIAGSSVASDGSLSGFRFIPTDGFVNTIEEDGAYVYFVDPSTQYLMAAGIRAPNGSASRAVASDVDPASALQIDSACAYWVDSRAGNVVMVHK